METLFHAREYAIDQLYAYYKHLGIPKAYWLRPDLTENVKKEIDEMQKSGRTKEEIDRYKETTDFLREDMITFIRKGDIGFDGDKLIQKLKTPIVSTDGNIKIEKLEYQDEFTVDDMEKALEIAGDTESILQSIKATIFLRTGVNMAYLGRMRQKDWHCARQILKVFTLEAMPLD